MSSQEKKQLPRVLGPVAAFCVVVGSVIGSGIFIVPGRVATQVPFLSGIIAIWVVGGLFSLAGALTLAELSAMLPSAGGPYVYLREAFGKLPAFLFGWAEFLVIRTGSIATLAAAFALNFSTIVPPPGGINPVAWDTLIACLAIAILAAINAVGTKIGGGVQVVGTALKVGALVAMILLPFFVGKVNVDNLRPFLPTELNSGLIAGMSMAIISVLWSYDGWVNASALAEEIKDPGKNIPRSLMLGLFTLIAIYLSMTILYHLVLPISAVQGGKGIVSGRYLQALIGDRGPVLIAAIIMASTFITLNGNALSGPRAYFAMARDGVFPASLCRISSRFQTPANAIIAQAVWAVVLVVVASFFLMIEPPKYAAGNNVAPPFWASAWKTLHDKPLYDVLYTYVIFGGTIFYGLSIVSVFFLRKSLPDIERPYRTWGYPFTPVLYTLASVALLASMLIQSFFESIAGLAIIAAGIPAYLFFSRKPVSTVPDLDL